MHIVPKLKTNHISDTVKGVIRNVLYDIKARGQDKHIHNDSDTSLWRLIKECIFIQN